jgi:sterol desaturase/sphingolipid hydroxylase (fatty acid hydroxylase superfamily)
MELSIQFLLLAFSPIFILTLGAEFLYLRKHGAEYKNADFTWADTISNGTLALLHEISDGLFNTLFIMGIYFFLYEYRLFTIENSLLSFIGLFLLQDFCYYWFHRGSHKIRYMWASHVVHHSSERLNLSTAFRQSFTYPISGMWLFWVPIVLIGFEPEIVVGAVLLSLAYQFFVHTQVVPKLGWFEWIFNTPSHHRVHHAKNPEYIDQNYGGVLIIWDRLFNTFVEERDDIQCEYGITRQINSHNPLYLTLHEWKDMFADAFAKNKPFTQRVKHFWAPPEWQPSPTEQKSGYNNPAPEFDVTTRKP